MTIYEQLGQENGIRTAVDDFYERVTADPALKSYFEGIDMARLRSHQAQLLIQVTGGPERYEGRDLATAHRGLGITSEAYERVVGHLAATLSGMGVEASIIGDVAAALDGYRSDIVTADASPA
jgi:hemoglobin